MENSTYEDCTETEIECEFCGESDPAKCPHFGEIAKSEVIFTQQKTMKKQKCELCPRATPANEIEEITFNGNTFQACELCRNYLSTLYTIDVPVQPESV